MFEYHSSNHKLCSIPALLGSVCIALAGLFPTALAQEVPTLGQLSLQDYVAKQNLEIEFNSGPLRLPSSFLAELVVAVSQPLSEGAQSLPTAVILQLNQPLTHESKAALQASGIYVEEYLGGTTYLAAITTDPQPAALSATFSSFVSAGGPLTAISKITPAALETYEATGELHEEAETAQPSLTVEFLRVVEPEHARAELKELDL